MPGFQKNPILSNHNHHEGGEKSGLASKDVSNLSKALYVAKEMGIELGFGEVLQRTV